MISEMVALDVGLRAVIGRENGLASRARAWGLAGRSSMSASTASGAASGARPVPPSGGAPHGTPTLLGWAEFVADLTEVGRARGLVRDLLGREHPGCHDVELCTCELVTNSLVHTSSEKVSLSVFLARVDRAVRVEVADAGGPGTEPQMRSAAPDNEWYEQGRGLCVVDVLTGGRWGSWTDNAGRTTWAEITF